jgi:two-component system sensor histidine kinase TctE
VLERFYRMRGTQGEGNGLGLAIADEIARVHRSQLELQSGAAGRGLRVTLLLGGKHALGVQPAQSGIG